MIKIVGKTETVMPVCCSYIPESYAFNIDFGIMNDTNIINAYRVTNTSMIWIVEGNMIGEIEVLSPEMVSYTTYVKYGNIEKFFGVPLVVIDSDLNKSAVVELYQNKFIIWFEKNMEINRKYIYQDLVFYVSNNQVVAIEARNYKTMVFGKS